MPSASLPPLRGILLDMDGVVVDSRPLLFEALRQQFSGWGIEIQPEDFEPFLGTGEEKLLQGIAGKYGATVQLPRDLDALYALYFELIPGRLKAMPGVFDFIETAHARGLKVALASSAAAVKVERNLREIGLSVDRLDAIVAGNEVERRKPHPDIFLAAAGRLGLKPDACLVVEDAVAGVQAAKAAGCRCLALTTTTPAEKLTAADWVIPDLAHLPANFWNGIP